MGGRKKEGRGGGEEREGRGGMGVDPSKFWKKSTPLVTHGEYTRGLIHD